MEYLNMKNETNSVLIALDDKNVEFWCEHDPKTFVGSFHDNSKINLKVLVGATAEEFTEKQAEETLNKVADATKNTAASRYACEIKDWITSHIDKDLPF